MAFDMSEICLDFRHPGSEYQKMAVCYEHGNEPSGSIRCREFLHKLRNC